MSIIVPIGENVDVSPKLSSVSSVIFLKFELPSKIETLKQRLCWYKLDETFCMLKWFSNQTINDFGYCRTRCLYFNVVQQQQATAILLVVVVLFEIVEFLQFEKWLFSVLEFYFITCKITVIVFISILNRFTVCLWSNCCSPFVKTSNLCWKHTLGFLQGSSLLEFAALDMDDARKRRV